MSVAMITGSVTPRRAGGPASDGIKAGQSGWSRSVAAAYLVALIVQDFGPSQRVLGRFGSNLALFVLPLLVLAHLPEIKTALATPRLRQLVRHCSLFAYVTATVSAFLLLSMPTSARGEILAIKAVKEIALFALWSISIVAGYVIIRYHRELTRKMLWVLLVACAALLAYEVAAPGNMFARPGIFHAGLNIQMRPRLLTTESSIAGSLFAGLGLALVLVEGRRLYRGAAVALATVGVVGVQSKGTLATWSMALAAGYLVSLLRGSWRRNVLSPVFALAIVLAGAFLASQVGSIVAGALQRDRNQSTSSATRSAYLLSAKIGLLDQPWGGGFGGNIVAAEEWLTEAREELTPKFRGGAFEEIDALLRADTDRAFSPKSLPVTLIYWGGLGGLAFFCLFGLNLARAALANSRVTQWAPVVAAFILLGTFSYISSFYEYEISLLVGGIFALEADR